MTKVNHVVTVNILIVWHNFRIDKSITLTHVLAVVAVYVVIVPHF